MSKEEQPGSQHPETETVSESSFSEEHSLSELHKADEHNFLQSSLLDESNVKETCEFSKVTEEDVSEEFTFDEGETVDNSSYGEELIEPSTDEELRIWRYPESKAKESVTAGEKQLFTEDNKGVLKSLGQDKEKGESSINHEKLTDTQCAEFSSSADVSRESGFPKQQEGEKPEIGHDVDNSAKGKMDSSESWCEEMPNQNDDTFQQTQESQAVHVKSEAQALEEKQSGNADLSRNAEDVDLTSGISQIHGTSRAQSSADIQGSDSHEVETDSTDGREDVVDGLTAETHQTESSRKVTFILEPELINSSSLTESDISMESRTETSLSGEASLKRYEHLGFL